MRVSLEVLEQLTVSASATRSVWQKALPNTVLILLCLFPSSLSSDLFKCFVYLFIFLFLAWHWLFFDDTSPCCHINWSKRQCPIQALHYYKQELYLHESLTKPQWAQRNIITTVTQVENTIKQITFRILINSELLFLSLGFMKNYAKWCQKRIQTN